MQTRDGGPRTRRAHRIEAQVAAVPVHGWADAATTAGNVADASAGPLGASTTGTATAIVQVAAPAAARVCTNGVAWTRRVAHDGLVLTLEGRGGEPFRTITVTHEGKALATITATWERRANSWRLVRQAAVSADGLRRESISTQWPDATSPSLRDAEAAVPQAPCHDPLEQRLGFRAAEAPVLGLAGAAVHASARPRGTREEAPQCTVDQWALEMRCFGEKMDVVEKGALVVGTATTMGVACGGTVLTGGAALPACIVATAAHVAASAALAAAVYRLQSCLDRERMLACGGGGGGGGGNNGGPSAGRSTRASSGAGEYHSRMAISKRLASRARPTSPPPGGARTPAGRTCLRRRTGAPGSTGAPQAGRAGLPPLPRRHGSSWPDRDGRPHRGPRGARCGLRGVLPSAPSCLCVISSAARRPSL